MELTTTMRDTTSGSALLTPAEVSRYLGVPAGTLANWRYQERGPAFLRVGRHVRYRSEDIDSWVQSQLADASTCRGTLQATQPRSLRR